MFSFDELNKVAIYLGVVRIQQFYWGVDNIIYLALIESKYNYESNQFEYENKFELTKQEINNYLLEIREQKFKNLEDGM